MQSEHVHRWLCGSGERVKGVCACGAEREFTNAAIKSSTGRQQIALRPRRFTQPTAAINTWHWGWHAEQKLKRIV